MTPKTLFRVAIVSGTAASIAVFLAKTFGADDSAVMIGGGVGGAVAAIMVSLKQKDGGDDTD